MQRRNPLEAGQKFNWNWTLFPKKNFRRNPLEAGQKFNGSSLHLLGAYP